jgi:hypothetical protein
VLHTVILACSADWFGSFRKFTSGGRWTSRSADAQIPGQRKASLFRDVPALPFIEDQKVGGFFFRQLDGSRFTLVQTQRPSRWQADALGN